jgi:hypothetical protein
MLGNESTSWKVAPSLLLLLVAVACHHQPQGAFSEERYCLAAQSYLADSLNTLALVDPDTIQDWRTRQTVLGCRVYASQATRLNQNAAATEFYDRLLASGWTRTPNAMDMPNEAAIRVRQGNVDCLFHVYKPPLLNTATEIAVTDAIDLQPGESQYNLLAQCMPAREAVLE